MHKRLVPLAVAMLLVACASKPVPLEPPAADLPGAWGAQGTPAQVGADWWKNFGDPALAALVEEALAGNRDVSRALARVAQSRAQLRLADADRSPQLGVQASAARSRAPLGSVPPGTSREGNQFGAGLEASYELDLWGRYAQASQAARAELAASEADQGSVRITVAAEVARLYFGLVALDAQTQISRRAIAQQREALGLQQRRVDAGVISDFELRQLQAEIATLEADLPGLLQRRDQTQTALAVLVGRSPRGVMEAAVAAGTPVLPADLMVPQGLPSELLLRRPDLVRAQHRLAAADARVEVARLEGYPSIALTGSLGSTSSRLSDLFSGPSFIWSLGAQVAQSILDGGRRDATTEAARAQRQLALLDWQASVAQAFGEVRDALTAQAGNRAAAAAQRERMAALQRVLELARLRFNNGIASQLDVLDAERSLLAAQSALVGAEQNQRNALVDLYKALGGGWQPLPRGL